MSASLVGSEMCIRDRLSTPRGSTPRPPALVQRFPTAAPSQAPLVGGLARRPSSGRCARSVVRRPGSAPPDGNHPGP
eukprot:15459768-Alexandrium_andersonii.AAC.1